MDRRNSMGDVVKHISKDDLCPFCKKRKATLMCDMPHSTVVTHARCSGFKSYIMTCDKKICTECTTRVNGFDFCPDCMKVIKSAPQGVKESERC
jgi:hypothetical protein